MCVRKEDYTKILPIATSVDCFVCLATLGLASFWQNDYHHLDEATKVEDHMLTAYHSFMRLGALHLAQQTPDLSKNKACILQPSKIMEVTIYNHADNFMGLLVKYETQWEGESSGGTHTMETFVQLQRKYKVLKVVGPVTRLKNIEVSSHHHWSNTKFIHFLSGSDDIQFNSC